MAGRRRFGVAGVVAALAVAIAGGAGAAPAVCAFAAPPKVLLSEGDAHAKGSKLLQVWDTPDAPVLWSPAEPDGYEAFLARAMRQETTDPVRLLDQNPYANSHLVAANAAAWIAPANCLEMLLYQAQDQRIETFTAPTEFMAMVLRSPDGARLRVYFYSINQDGIGRATPVADPAEADFKAGWTILAGLHNHNFHPGDPTLNGPVAPSNPDAKFNATFAAEAGMQAAWITNGVSTAHIPAAAFGRFETEGP
ncbi:hypothetical protein [Phenylobacterium sp.]|uniref:hypothetical protein n=1 Tax=Phenylobacterium sp. TaxID=1871053 RepID=UPI00121C598B|nr:hypothetical protein [Phenylobacterium sp.]THD67304.1 MAG: hypothetical protein E8A12_05155 [Phenylobacterium sp.]